MSPLLLLGVVCGAMVAAGLVWLVWALTGSAPGPAAPDSRVSAVLARVWSGGRRSVAERRRYRMLVAAAAATGAVTWLVSGLFVLGLVTAAAVPGLPWLLAAGSAERRAIARVEAVADWTRRLRDVSGIGAGLQSAIVSSARTAPAAVAGPVGMLAARLQAGADARNALLQFADDIADPACDQVVAALLLHLSDRGERLGTVLASIAAAAGREAAMRKEQDSERSAARFSIRFMVGFAAVVVVGAAFAGEYMAPYGSPLGQIIMAVLVGGFVLTLLWVRTLTRPVPVPRLLRPVARKVEP